MDLEWYVIMMYFSWPIAIVVKIISTILRDMENIF